VRSEDSNRSTAIGRGAWILVLALAFVPAWSGAVHAQGTEGAPSEPPEEATRPEPDKPSVADFSKPMGPPDPFNRGTPRGSMYGFLTAARAGNYERASEFLDRRRLAPQDQDRAGEFARHLKVVLDQTLWVDLINLSDSNAGRSDDSLPAWQDRLGEIETSEGRVTLLLQRVPREGDGVRIWKVAASTVAQVPTLYAEFEPVWLEEWLPAYLFENEILGNALWKWFGLAVLLAVSCLFAMLIAGTTSRVATVLFTKANQGADERIVQLVRGPVSLAWAIIFFAVGHRVVPLGFSLSFVDAVRHVWLTLLVVAVTWLFFRLIDLGALALRFQAERRGNLGIIPTLVPGARFAKLVIVLIGTLGVLGTLGVNVSAVIAGLGVGGIAVALAAQKTIENLFGGITLFADRPVQVGDFCRYQGEVGTVEEIGLRSTRVRTLDRTVITIPNADFSNLRIENYGKRDRMRLWTMIGVRYETTPDQLRYVLALLREVLLAHPRITEDPARVRFVGFGAYSLDIEVFAYANTSEWSEFLGIREDVYLRFMEAIKQAGTSVAFPSSTTYLGRDDAPDPEESGAAERRVAAWREEGQLPFPNFPEERRLDVENTLEWPPTGSPDASKG